MKAFILPWLLCVSVLAAPAADGDRPSPFFQCQLINLAANAPGKSKLMISVGLPFDALNFIRSGREYEARFNLSIAIVDRDGFGVADHEMQKQFRVADYAETNSIEKYYFDLFEFDLPPGQYEATVTVTDAVSGRQTSFSGKKDLQNFAAGEVALSDIIITNDLATDSAGNPVIVPGLFQNRAAPGGKLHFYMEVNAPLGDQPLQVRQVIRDAQGKIVVDQKRPWPRQTAMEKMLLPVWTDHLPYGVYELEMHAQHGKAGKKARQKFHVIWNGIPASGMHVRQALAQAALVASAAERKEMERALADSSLAQQRAALAAFWDKRDDSPAAGNEAMTAFYRRVEVANERFGGSREGWKTDLGRIYIQLGTPDAIEVDSQHPRQQRKQIWRYHRLHRHFLFIDPFGLGDFVLAQEQGR